MKPSPGPQMRPARGLRRLSLAHAVGLLTFLCFGSAAHAQQSFAFAAFANDDAGFSDYLSAELAYQGGQETYDTYWTEEMLATGGCPPRGLQNRADCVTMLGETAGVTRLVEGEVMGGQSGEITVYVVDTANASLVATLTVDVEGGVVTPEAVQIFVAEIAALDLGPAPAQTAPPQQTTTSTTPVPTTNTVVTQTPDPPRQPREARDVMRPADRVRVGFSFDFVQRNFTVEQDAGDITFDAPFYPGLRLDLEVFPVAFFARDSAANGLGFALQLGKHDVTTVTDVPVAGETFDYEVPTRHDTSFYGLFYEWSATPELVVTPVVGWRVVEYALGNNPLYSSSFYQSIEIGAGADYYVSSAFTVGGRFAARPGVSLGSTATEYGDDASAFGWGLALRARYRLPFGLFAGAEFDYDRYATTYTFDGPSEASDPTATDSFMGFVLSVGYAY